MANAILPQQKTARRVSKALGIIVRQEVIPCDDRPGYFHVSDAGTGSGKVYTASATSCTCPDATFRGNRCKHEIAAEAEERELAAFCADWNTRSEQARAALDDLPGDFLSTDLNFADDVMLGEQVRQTSAKLHESPRCPDCGATLKSAQYHVGGKGYRWFLICSKDVEHRALPA